MYKIGSIVVYGTEGLCKICDITERTFGKETSEYYGNIYSDGCNYFLIKKETGVYEFY